MKLNVITRSGLAAASLAAVIFAGCLPAVAENITIVHNASPGGATGVSAQVLANEWSKTMPEHPTIVVQSVAGGAMTQGINFVLDARANGKTLGYLAWQGTTRILDPADLQIPFDTFGVIGGIGGSNFILHARTDIDSGYKDRDDFAKVPSVKLGAYSPKMTQGMTYAAALDILGIDWHYVSGMTGDGPLYAAMQRGEIDAYPATTTQFIAELKAGPIADGTTMAIWQSGPLLADGSMKRDPALEGIPTIDEYLEKATGKKPEGPMWDVIQYHSKVSAPVNWIVVAPPGTSEAELTMLRDSFDAATASPEYLAEVTKVFGSEPNIVHWQEMSEIMSSVSNTSEEIKDAMRTLVDRMEH